MRTLVLILSALLSACSVVQATQGPDHKDLSVFQPGTPRDLVLAEMGEPTVSTTDADGRLYEIWNFYQGSRRGAKAGRAAAYGVLAVMTLGVSEIATSPIEGSRKGSEMKIKVTYTDDRKVDRVEVIEDERIYKVHDVGEPQT